MKTPSSTYKDVIDDVFKNGTFVSPSESKEIAASIVEDWSDSYIDLFVLSKLLSDISKEVLDSVKENAYLETEILGHDNKFEYKGISITPVSGYKKYKFPEDDYITEVSGKLKQAETTVKGLKESIKAREKELIKEDKAILVSETKTLKISK